jgi:hypothetical protein
MDSKMAFGGFGFSQLYSPFYASCDVLFHSRDSKATVIVGQGTAIFSQHYGTTLSPFWFAIIVSALLCLMQDWVT